MTGCDSTRVGERCNWGSRRIGKRTEEGNDHYLTDPQL